MKPLRTAAIAAIVTGVSAGAAFGKCSCDSKFERGYFTVETAKRQCPPEAAQSLGKNEGDKMRCRIKDERTGGVVKSTCTIKGGKPVCAPWK